MLPQAYMHPRHIVKPSVINLGHGVAGSGSDICHAAPTSRAGGWRCVDSLGRGDILGSRSDRAELHVVTRVLLQSKQGMWRGREVGEAEEEEEETRG